MPLSLPNQQRQSTEDGKYHIPQTCSPQAHLGSAITVLNTKDSWLPQARDAKPLISRKPSVTPIPNWIRGNPSCKPCWVAWIFLWGLQARIRDSFSSETAFSLQHRRRRSCHTPVFTWRPRVSGRRSSGMERVTAQCHLCIVSLLIPATSENFSVPATTASITLITVSRSWSACTQDRVNPDELNWTERNSPGHWSTQSVP